jgi:hypothetical protein
MTTRVPVHNEVKLFSRCMKSDRLHSIHSFFCIMDGKGITEIGTSDGVMMLQQMKGEKK